MVYTVVNRVIILLIGVYSGRYWTIHSSFAFPQNFSKVTKKKDHVIFFASLLCFCSVMWSVYSRLFAAELWPRLSVQRLTGAFNVQHSVPSVQGLQPTFQDSDMYPLILRATTSHITVVTSLEMEWTQQTPWYNPCSLFRARTACTHRPS